MRNKKEESASIYYVTKIDSPVGKRMKAIHDKMTECFRFQKALAKEFGFYQWSRSDFHAYDCITSVFFKNDPDIKLWKKVGEGEWMPRLNLKAGKEIQKKFDAQPIVTRRELNECIGYKDKFVRRIGFAISKTHAGFIVGDDWKVKIPKECKEVTFTQYKKIFHIK